MATRKELIDSASKLTTSMADFRSIVGLDPDNFNAFSFSFVLDEGLQLVEAPVANPIVHNPSSSLLSYSFEVFHHYLVSVEVGNNLFADVVVIPSHVTSLSSRDFFQESLCGASAFALQFTSQEFKFPFNLFDFGGVEEPAIACDCEVVYSEVDSENFVLQSRVRSLDLFRETEQEVAFSFPIDSQQSFSHIPAEVWFITVWDAESEVFAGLEQSQAESVAFESCGTWKVVPDTCSLDGWFGFGFLDDSAGLFDAGYGELCWQGLSEMFVDEWVQLDVIPNLMFPCSVDAVLQCLRVSNDGLGCLSACGNPDSCGGSALHTDKLVEVA